MGIVRQIPGYGDFAETRSATSTVPGYGDYRETQSSGGGTTVSPGVGSLLVTGYAPTVTRTANQNIAPGVGSLRITGYAPTVSRTSGQTISPGLGQLLVTGYAPSVVRTASQQVAPGVGSLLVTGYAPAVLRTTGVTIQPGAGALLLTGYAPTVMRTASQSVAAGVGTILITGYAPSVTQTAPPADPRYARPASDVSAGTWTPSSGTDLYAMIDEVAPDSSDYISTATPGECEIKLGAVVDPQTSTGQAVRYQVWSDDGSGIVVSLLQGAAVIASWPHASLPTSPTIFEQFLTVAECDSITNYADLRMVFEKP